MEKLKIIICDIDNTVLDIRHRFHLLDGENTDWEKFLDPNLMMQDKPMEDTISVIECLSKQYTIVFITGRNEGTRETTFKQLSSIFSFPIWIFMRKDGDTKRSDAVIKKELYDTHIKDQYQVVAAFDDKSSIVDLWRSLGITAYHVGEIATGDGY